MRITCAVFLAQGLCHDKGSVKDTWQLSGQREGWQGGRKGLSWPMLLGALHWRLKFTAAFPRG